MKAADQNEIDECPVFRYITSKRKVVATLNVGDMIEFTKPLACLLG